MNIIYLDRLSLFSLITVIRSVKDYSFIFFFNASYKATTISNIFMRIGLLKVKPLPVDFCFADIRDEKGTVQAIRVNEDIKNICFKISDTEFVKNRFLKGFGRYFDFRKVLLFFEKAVANEINDTVIFMNVARWHVNNKVNTENKSIHFFIRKSLWSGYLLQYAAILNIRPLEYKCTNFSRYINCFNKVKRFVFPKIRLKLSTFKMNKGIKKKVKTSTQNIDKEVPLIAAWYTGKTIIFELDKRSDFFWLLRSTIPREKVLIYFDRTDLPVTEEKIGILDNEGVKYIALTSKATSTKNIFVWHSGVKYKQLKTNLILCIIKNYLVCIAQVDLTPLFYVIGMLRFVLQYSYWCDFYESNNIKIDVSPIDFAMIHIPKSLALKKCGGVNISYQWSNRNDSSIVTSNCTDVLFSFGSAYKQIFERDRAVIGHLLYCGYITDHSFQKVKSDALRLREQLLNSGVKFVICYFDENSSDGRMSTSHNKGVVEVYKYFLEKMLEDKTIGQVFKPGYPKTIYKRLSAINSLIEEAKKTGRCLFIEKGDHVTEQYPTEAAQVADLCIGHLASGTAALEAYLSGTPTVFLDLEKLYSNPVYQWGRGKVVFDSLDGLFSAILRYRENPASVPGFGDLSDWVKDRDPFKDGNASLRMGQYINWLFEGFKEGGTRENAVKYANQRYAELWGRENVVKWH